MPVLLIIAASTILRLVLAVVLGLGVDESYEVVVARHLSWSYFDHPPLVFWILHGVTSLFGESRLAVRAPFILLFAGTTWLLYRLTARMFGERAGVIAALLLQVAPVFGLSSGGWALPDGPLLFCTAAAALALVHATREPEGRATTWWWLATGVATGGALLSKYHGAILGLAIVGFLVTQPAARAWLRRPQPWLAAALALLMFVPVVAWNAAHGWVSFRFQAGRGGGVGGHGLHVTSLLESLGGQAGYLLPWIWIPLLWVFVGALRRGTTDARTWLMACLAAGPIVIFTLIALGGSPGLPHWEAPGYLMLMPLLGAAAAARLERGSAATGWWLGVSAAAFVVLVIVAASQTATGWLTPHSAALRREDPTLEMLDWKDLGPAAAGLGVSEEGRFVAAGNWIQAGKAGYGVGAGASVVCLCEQPHHFGIAANLEQLRGRDALIVEAGRRDPARFAPWFETIAPRGDVRVLRAGRPALVLELSVGRGFRGR